MPSRQISATTSQKAYPGKRATERSHKYRPATSSQKTSARAKANSLQKNTKQLRSGQKKTKIVRRMPTRVKLDSTSKREAILAAIRQICSKYRLPANAAGDATAVLLGTAVIARQASAENQIAAASPITPPVLSKDRTSIEWPAERFADARDKYGEDIVKFLRRVWADAVIAGATRKDLRDHDTTAEMAVSNYLRRTPEFPDGRKLPQDIALPTKKEVNDRILASGSVPSSEVARLGASCWRRQKALAPGD